DNAHEMLLLEELGTSQMAFSDRWQRGDGHGVNVGDFNFIAQGASPGDLGYIAFVRNNVVCIVRDGRPEHPANVDVLGLAVEIDAVIRSSPDLQPADFDSLRPLVRDFHPDASTLVVGSSTALRIVAEDPRGEKIETILSSGGKLEIDTDSDPVRIRPTHVLGV